MALDYKLCRKSHPVVHVVPLARQKQQGRCSNGTVAQIPCQGLQIRQRVLGLLRIYQGSRVAVGAVALADSVQGLVIGVLIVGRGFRGRADIVRFAVHLKRKSNGTYRDQVACANNSLHDALTVNEGSVGTAQVLYDSLAVFLHNTTVLARYGHAGNSNVAVGPSSQRVNPRLKGNILALAAI